MASTWGALLDDGGETEGERDRVLLEEGVVETLKCLYAQTPVLHRACVQPLVLCTLGAHAPPSNTVPRQNCMRTCIRCALPRLPAQSNVCLLFVHTHLSHGHPRGQSPARTCWICCMQDNYVLMNISFAELKLAAVLLNNPYSTALRCRANELASTSVYKSKTRLERALDLWQYKTHINKTHMPNRVCVIIR